MPRPYRNIVTSLVSATSSRPAATSAHRNKGEDDEPFEAKMARLVAQLREQQAEARRLDEAIWKNMKELGYDT
jgi:cytochrome c556